MPVRLHAGSRRQSQTRDWMNVLRLPRNQGFIDRLAASHPHGINAPRDPERSGYIAVQQVIHAHVFHHGSGNFGTDAYPVENVCQLVIETI